MRFYLTDATRILTGTASAALTILDGSGAKVAGTTANAEGKATVPSSLGLDDYTYSWSDGAVGAFDVAGFPYFTEAQLRSFDPQLSSTVGSDDIVSVREQVEDVFDTASGTAFCPRSSRQSITADGGSRFPLEKVMPLYVESCTVGGIACGGVSLDGMQLVFDDAPDEGSAIEVKYVYGSMSAPGALLHNALVYADSLIGSPAVNPRATGMQSEFGYARYAVAGKDGPTGIPEVDAFLSADPRKGGHGIGRLTIA